MRRHGFALPEELITGDDLQRLEPALSPRLRAGFHVEEHWHVRPPTLTAGIARRLRELGVEIRGAARVEGFATAGGAVESGTHRTPQVPGTPSCWPPARGPRRSRASSG